VEGFIEVVGEETSSSSELGSAKASFPIFCFNERRKWHGSYSENFVQCFKQHPYKASLQSGVEAQYNSLASHQCLRGNSLYAIANFINPGSAIAKPLIPYVPLSCKIKPVYAIHIIFIVRFFLK
jgi:hypothetical protein